MIASTSRYRVLYKAIALAIVCLFLVNDIAWAQNYSNYHPSNTTLAAQSSFNRITPFFEEHGLEFKNRAGLICVAIRLNKLFNKQNLDDVEISRAINRLNSQVFSDKAVRIDESIQKRKLIGNDYSCVIFNFEKDGRIIEALFLREAFKILAGKELPQELSGITDINEFIRRITFTLPAAKVIDYNHNRQLNKIIRKNIEAAA